MKLYLSKKGNNWAIFDCKYSLEDEEFACDVWDKLFFWGNKCICLCESLNSAAQYSRKDVYVTIYKDGLKNDAGDELINFINDYSDLFVDDVQGIIDLARDGFIEILNGFTFSDYSEVTERENEIW